MSFFCRYWDVISSSYFPSYFFLNILQLVLFLSLISASIRSIYLGCTWWMMLWTNRIFFSSSPSNFLFVHLSFATRFFYLFFLSVQCTNLFYLFYVIKTYRARWSLDPTVQICAFALRDPLIGPNAERQHLVCVCVCARTPN